MHTLDKGNLLTFGAAFIALLLVLGALVSMGESVLPLGIIIFPVILWLTQRRAFNPSYVSPTTLVCGYFIIIGTLGYVLRDTLVAADGRGASIVLMLSEGQSLQTLSLIMSVASIIIIVSGLSLRLFGVKDSGVRERSFRKFKWGTRAPKGGWLLLAAVPLLAMVAELGISSLFLRSSYLFAAKGSFSGSIGATLATAGIGMLGYMVGACQGGKRLAALALLSGYAGILFSFGSRRLALIPILIALGMFIAKNTRATRLGLPVGAVATIALMPVPLMLRGSTSHGILPYIERMSKYSLDQADWLAILNNVLVSFPIIGSSAFGIAKLQVSDLLISLNPVSGDAAGWYDIAPRLRLNGNTPMAAIGELGNVGWVPVVVFSIAIGITLAWVELAVRWHIVSGLPIVAALLVGLCGLFALQMMQYNLRSAFRMLVYLLAMELGLRACRLFLGRKRSAIVHSGAPDASATQDRRADVRKPA
jgi:hypothetical protein